MSNKTSKCNHMDTFDMGHNWISVKDRLPDNLQEIIVTFKNHCPAIYYSNIKDKQLTGICVHYKGEWYWYSKVTTDLLSEYGKCDPEKVDKNIEITHWKPLPEPYADGRWLKRGKWIERNVFGENPLECPFCGNSVNVYGYSYCPNCGADMRGDEE